jgi:hypothetical protein
VWLPRVQDGKLEIEKVERGGRPLQATGVHERIMELLTATGTPRIHGSVTPRKIIERVRLGEPQGEGQPPILGIKASDVLESFFRDVAPPRLESAAILRKGIARGVAERLFAYASGGSPPLGSDGRFQVSQEKVIFNRPLADDEIDFDSGFLMVPAAMPEAATAYPPGGIVTVPPPVVHEGPTGTGAGTGPAPAPTGPEVSGRKKRIAMTFEATREQVYKAFPAIANLADKSDGAKVSITVEGSSEAGFDPSWLRNAVDEPLDEADIERTAEE